MEKSTSLKILSVFIFSLYSLVYSDMMDGFRCIYKIGQPDLLGFDKSADVMQHVSVKNIDKIKPALTKSSRCLIATALKDEKLLGYLASIKLHVVILDNVTCSDLPPSDFQTEMYCSDKENIWEKYKVRDKTVLRRVSTGMKSLVSLGRETLRRRSNLVETEFIVTTLKTSNSIQNLKYGNTTEARISGIFGDFFMVLSKSLNFTFTLVKPDDGKWGGRSDGRAMGWNGMVGDIAEGLADFGIGPFTISAARSEVIRFSIGNVEYVKTFFFSTETQKVFNYFLFFNPLATDSWIAILLVILFTGLTLFFIMCIIMDKQFNEFTLRKCFTLTTTAICFARRWTVTPTSISGRVVFITVLITGVLTQVSFDISKSYPQRDTLF